MKRFKDVVRMVRLFYRLVFEMLKNYRRLNDDLDNNFAICKKICNKIIRSAKIRLNTYGCENLPRDNKFLLVSNHRCFFDVVFLIAAIEETVSFVAAKELWKYPVLRKYLSSIACVPLDRCAQGTQELKHSILSMRSALETGNLVLFPEGECSYHSFQIRKFKKGGFLDISSMKQCIVPVFLQMDKLKNIGRWMIPQGEVGFHVGSSFTPEDIGAKRNTAREIAAYAQKRVLLLQENAEKDG